MLITDLRSLPNADERSDSDDTPVDTEDQNLLPNLLLATLYRIWEDRQDWFFGVDMGLYHTSGDDPKVPVVPDAFLSLGVERRNRPVGWRNICVHWGLILIISTIAVTSGL